jgi:hypothetical protein
MKKMITVAAAAICLSTSASAATLTIVGGGPGVIPGGTAKNDVLDSLFLDAAPLDGVFGANIVASGFGSGSKVLVEVMGWEAGFKNTFETVEDSFETPGGNVDLLEVAANLNSPIKQWLTDASGGLAFEFLTPQGDVKNGMNVMNDSGEVNFFASMGADKSIWLWLDDTGAGNDDNHDDLVVRLSAVPLPAGMLLLLTGLGALVVRRRKTV